MIQTPNKQLIKKAIQNALTEKYPTTTGNGFRKFSETMSHFVDWVITETSALEDGCLAAGVPMNPNNTEQLVVECADSLEDDISDLVANVLTERVCEYVAREQGDKS